MTWQVAFTALTLLLRIQQLSCGCDYKFQGPQTRTPAFLASAVEAMHSLVVATADTGSLAQQTQTEPPLRKAGLG